MLWNCRVLYYETMLFYTLKLCSYIPNNCGVLYCITVRYYTMLICSFICNILYYANAYNRLLNIILCDDIVVFYVMALLYSM